MDHSSDNTVQHIPVTLTPDYRFDRVLYRNSKTPTFMVDVYDDGVIEIFAFNSLFRAINIPP